MSIRSDEHGCVGLCCSRDDECFCGMVSIKFGSVVVCFFVLTLFLLISLFNLIVFFGLEDSSKTLPLSWHPHLAILLTLAIFGIFIYFLALLGSLSPFKRYTDVFYLIFLIINIIILLFHLIFAILALSMAFSLIALLYNQPRQFFPTTISASGIETSKPTIRLQLGRSLIYFFLALSQIYAEFVIGRARLYWIRHEKNNILARNYLKPNKVSPSVKFDIKK